MVSGLAEGSRGGAVMLKATGEPKAEPVTLTYRGLEWCDGCGARLKPGDQMGGLCPVCAQAKAEDQMHGPE